MELWILMVFVVINLIFLFLYKDYIENKYKTILLIKIKKEVDSCFEVIENLKKRPSILSFYPNNWSNIDLANKQFLYYGSLEDAELKLYHILKVDDYAKKITYPNA